MKVRVVRVVRSRLAVAVALVLCSLAVLVAPATRSGVAAAAAQHPRLLFDAAEIPALRARVQSGVPARLWATLQHKVECYLDRACVRYVDPATPHTGEQNAQGVFLTDLAFAYIVSGDERYGRHAVDMLLQTAAQGWPAWNSNELGKGDMTKGVALAFDWTYDLMTPEERSTITSSLVAGLPLLPPDEVVSPGVFSCLDRDSWIENARMNWAGVCGGGNGLALLAIEGEPGVPDLAPWLAVARDRVLPYWQQGFGSLGDGNEGHVYAEYGLHNSLPFALAWERARGESFADQAPGIANLVEWLTYEQLPQGGSRFVPRNDAGTPSTMLAEVLPFFFVLAPDGLTGWLWDHTVGPDGDDITTLDADEIENPVWPGDSSCALPADQAQESASWTLFCMRSSEVFSLLYYRNPEELPRVTPDDALPAARHHPEYGLVDMRTGWEGGPDELQVTFEAKRRSNGHFQLDHGNFTIYGYDAMFAVDSGYGHNYSCAGNPVAQLAFGCTDTDSFIDNGRATGHNVVLVDNSKFSQSLGGPTTQAETIPLFLAAPTASLVRSDLRGAYTNATFGAAPWAERDFLVREPADGPVLVVIADRLRRGGGAHTYQWTMHSDIANRFLTDGSTFSLQAPSGSTLTGAASEASNAALVYAEPWDHTRYMADPPLVHNIVKSTSALQDDFDHLALLAVTPSGGSASTVNRLEAAGGTLIAASWTGGEVLVASRAHESDALSSPRLETDGALAMVRVDRGETTLVGGTTLVADGRAYVTISGGPGTVLADEDMVLATGPAGASFRMFAPQPVETVTLNGKTVPFRRQGDEIVFR